MSSGQLFIPIEYLEVPLPPAYFLVWPTFRNKSAPFNFNFTIYIYGFDPLEPNEWNMVLGWFSRGQIRYPLPQMWMSRPFCSTWGKRKIAARMLGFSHFPRSFWRVQFSILGHKSTASFIIHDRKWTGKPGDKCGICKGVTRAVHTSSTGQPGQENSVC